MCTYVRHNYKILSRKITLCKCTEVSNKTSRKLFLFYIINIV